MLTKTLKIIATNQIEIIIPSENKIKKYIFDNLKIVSPWGNFFDTGALRGIVPLFKTGTKRLEKVQYYSDLKFPEGVTSGNKLEVCCFSIPISEALPELIYQYILEKDGIELGSLGLVSVLITKPDLLQGKMTASPGKKELFYIEGNLVNSMTTMQRWEKSVDEVADGEEEEVNFIYFKKV